MDHPIDDSDRLKPCQSEAPGGTRVTRWHATLGPPWKSGNEFLPYHPSASHIPPEHRDGWNYCFAAAHAEVATQEAIEAESAELVIASLRCERDELHNRLHDQAVKMRPLSEATIAELWRLLQLTDEPSILALARAVEKAHGIDA